jgi:hypothetical protein
MDTKNTTRLRKSAGLINSCGFRHGRQLVAKAGSWPVTAQKEGICHTESLVKGELYFRIPKSFARLGCGPELKWRDERREQASQVQDQVAVEE